MIYQTVDLNLFALFEALIRTRSVTASARELGVTPSAASHGLARLRRLMKDELFVPSPKGMQPTVRARELGPGVAEALSRIEATLLERPFNPFDEGRLFTIVASDDTAGMIVPYLARRLLERAPGSQLRVLPHGRPGLLQLLDEGRVDLVFGWFDSLPGRIGRQALLTERRAVVVRRGHKLAGRVPTVDQLLDQQFVAVEAAGTECPGTAGSAAGHTGTLPTWIDRLLFEAGRPCAGRRRVAVTVPSYAEVTQLLCMTDLVAIVPRRVADRASRHDGLIILDLPYEPMEMTVEMIWHDRAAEDPGLRWLAAQTQAAVQDLLSA